MNNEEKILEMLGQMQSQMTQMNTRLDKMDTRLDKMDTRFDKVDARLDQMDVRFDKMDARLDQMDTRMSSIETEARGTRVLMEEQGRTLKLVAEGVNANSERLDRMADNLDDVHETLLAHELFILRRDPPAKEN